MSPRKPVPPKGSKGIFIPRKEDERPVVEIPIGNGKVLRFRMDGGNPVRDSLTDAEYAGDDNPKGAA